MAKKTFHHRECGGHRVFKRFFSVPSVGSVVKSFGKPTKLDTLTCQDTFQTKSRCYFGRCDYLANSLITRAMCFACFKYRSRRMFSLGAWAFVSG
jgi:hypothetical protein